MMIRDLAEASFTGRTATSLDASTRMTTEMAKATITMRTVPSKNARAFVVFPLAFILVALAQ